MLSVTQAADSKLTLAHCNHYTIEGMAKWLKTKKRLQLDAGAVPSSTRRFVASTVWQVIIAFDLPADYEDEYQDHQ